VYVGNALTVSRGVTNGAWWYFSERRSHLCRQRNLLLKQKS